jgi:hypothetical protein
MAEEHTERVSEVKRLQNRNIKSNIETQRRLSRMSGGGE